MTNRKRYALVGTGGRALMFVDSIVKRFSKDCELVAICDTNPTRMDYYNKHIVQELDGTTVPSFDAQDFDTMIRTTSPDVVVVTTVDAFHHQYILRALELGCDVITEKPMTIDAEKCRSIVKAAQHSNNSIKVAFNYRWRPGCTLVRQLLKDKVIGDIIHVDMDYLLDTSHGADYFRRWHRDRKNSGGLLVHKGTHHFDLVNWWLDAVPETIFGMGRLAFYGKENAEQRELKISYDRYTGQETQSDPFAIDLNDSDRTRGLYLEAEKHDGYMRDQNVFGDGVTIEDTMSLLVRYRTGVVMNYSLNAYMPREGFSIALNGTKGRLEYQENHSSGNEVSNHNEVEKLWKDRLVVLPHFGDPYEVPIPVSSGAHGGADPPLQEQLFSETPPAEIWGRNAGHGQGAASILVGIAGHKSFETGEPQSIADLCPELGDEKQLSKLP